MSKKLHAKDLRRDEVAEVVTHAAEDTVRFSQQHRRGLVVGAAAVAVLAIGAVVVAWRSDASAQSSFKDYAAAMDKLDKASATDTAAGEGKPTLDEAAAALGKVADDHSGTTAGRLAAYEQGLALIRAGKAKEGADVLEAFVAKNASYWTTPNALAALAAAREDAGDAKAAEDALVRLRDGKWRSWPDGAAQILLAEFYERQGRMDDAKAIYQTLSKDEKLLKSAYGAQAKSRLEDLGGASAS